MFVPFPIVLTLVLGEEGDKIFPDPLITVHEPVPTDAEFPFIITVGLLAHKV